jgi:hypothetical protein
VRHLWYHLDSYVDVFRETGVGHSGQLEPAGKVWRIGKNKQSLTLISRGKRETVPINYAGQPLPTRNSAVRPTRRHVFGITVWTLLSCIQGSEENLRGGHHMLRMYYLLFGGAVILQCFQYLDCMTCNCNLDWQMMKWKGFRRKRLWPNRDTILVFTGMDWENHEIVVKIVGVRVEIPTWNLPDTILKRYLCANLLSIFVTYLFILSLSIYAFIYLYVFICLRFIYLRCQLSLTVKSGKMKVNTECGRKWSWLN